MVLTGRDLLVTGNPIFDENGDPSLIVAILRDVTDLNRVRRELEERIFESNRYKAELERLRNLKKADWKLIVLPYRRTWLNLYYLPMIKVPSQQPRKAVNRDCLRWPTLETCFWMK